MRSYKTHRCFRKKKKYLGGTVPTSILETDTSSQNDVNTGILWFTIWSGSECYMEWGVSVIWSGGECYMEWE